MTKLISLNEAIRTGLIKEGDYINPTSCFMQDNREVLIKKESSGCERDQLFSREEKYLKWIYARDYKGIPTLFSAPTFFELGMKGKTGYENIQKVLKRICSTYSNEDSRIFARALRQEDVELLIKKSFIDRIIKKDKRRIWLDNTYIPYGDGAEFLGVRTVGWEDDDTFYGVQIKGKYNIGTCYLHNSRLEIVSNELIFGICNVIFLEDAHIVVNVNSKEIYGEWKLLLSQKYNKHG